MVSQGSRNSTYITGGVSKISASDKERKKKILIRRLIDKRTNTKYLRGKKIEDKSLSFEVLKYTIGVMTTLFINEQ